MPINMFLGLSKAFDTIDHNILLHKLKFYGLDGSILLLFESYLSNQRQYVEIDEMQSSKNRSSTRINFRTFII